MTIEMYLRIMFLFLQMNSNLLSIGVSPRPVRKDVILYLHLICELVDALHSNSV